MVQLHMSRTWKGSVRLARSCSLAGWVREGFVGWWVPVTMCSAALEAVTALSGRPGHSSSCAA